jgi:hypothetical protein
MAPATFSHCIFNEYSTSSFDYETLHVNVPPKPGSYTQVAQWKNGEKQYKHGLTQHIGAVQK